ncbi:MAG TPA: hypothetical protein PKD86_09410 [Gemmatales bacterium]|nr:hypothetical protein [Gemmatales bacterium]HMP59557.1 hypothetical protein [Gemmatales bacterium]
MKQGTRSRLALGMLLALGFVGLMTWRLSAESQDDNRPRGRPLTERRLADFLDGLGYEPKESEADNGAIICKIKLQMDTWTFAPTVELSPDKSICWVVVGLQRLPNPDRAPRDVLIRLLQENDAGLRFFSMDKKNYLIKVNLPMPNYEISPTSFRQQIDFMIAMIRRTENLWNPKKWDKDEGLSDRP